MEYNKFSVKELKNILDKKGVKGYSKYKKDELINILSKLEKIEDQENETQDEIEIPLPPKINIETQNQVEEETQNEVQEETQNEVEVEEETKDEVKVEVETEERIKDPVKLFENFKPSLLISGNKKSEILKGMIEYKTAQKMLERQEIQREIDKAIIELRTTRQEILAVTDAIKKDLKEVRESFLMSSLIILHNFSFLPLDKLPIFKNQKK